jgi:hypothetical protein
VFNRAAANKAPNVVVEASKFVLYGKELAGVSYCSIYFEAVTDDRPVG